MCSSGFASFTCSHASGVNQSFPSLLHTLHQRRSRFPSGRLFQAIAAFDVCAICSKACELVEFLEGCVTDDRCDCLPPKKLFTALQKVSFCTGGGGRLAGS